MKIERISEGVYYVPSYCEQTITMLPNFRETQSIIGFNEDVFDQQDALQDDDQLINDDFDKLLEKGSNPEIGQEENK